MVDLDLDEVVAALAAELGVGATAARAAAAKRYLKSDLAFVGASVPTVRRVARAFVRQQHLQRLDRRVLRALAERLWRRQVNELRSVAIGILELTQAKLSPADTGWLIALIDDADTWAHVDWLAIKVLGPLLARAPTASGGRKLDAWARHPNFWVRRTALLVFHDELAAGRGDFDHFARLAAGMLDEREFFIRKAIGWVLRTTAKRTPARTYTFVARHAPAFSSLSFKEATRALSAAQQTKLRALRSAPAPRARPTRSPPRAVTRAPGRVRQREP